MPHCRILFGYLLIAALGACRPPETELEPAPDEPPVVGKLQFQDRVVDLTLEAFSDDPNSAGVPTNSHANVMADIIVDKREDKPAGVHSARGVELGDVRTDRSRP